MSDKAHVRFKHLMYEGAGICRQPTPMLPLSNLGLTWIRGPEGSGKTTIPEVLTTVLFGKGSPRLRADRLTESTLANEDTGYLASLAFESGSGAHVREVAISQSFKHPIHKSRYTIEIDGSSDNCPTKKPEQRKLVAKLAPLSYDEWLGIGYLSQGGVHDLLAGTAMAKQNYLTTVFGLSFYEDLIATAKAKAKEFGGVDLQATQFESDLRTLAEEREEMLRSIEREPSPESLDAQILSLTEKLQKFSAKIASYQTYAASFAELAKVEEKLAVAWPNDDVAPKERRDALTAEIETVESDLETTRAKHLQSAQQLATHQGAVKSYHTAKENLKAAKAAVAEAEVPEFNAAQLADLDPLVVVADTYDVLPQKGKVRATVDEAVTAFVEARSAATSLARLRKSIGKASDCPTCNQPLASIDDALAAAEVAREKAKTALACALFTAGLEDPSAVRAAKAATSVLAKLTERMEARREQYADATERMGAYDGPSDDDVAAQKAAVVSLTAALQQRREQLTQATAAQSLVARRNTLNRTVKPVLGIDLPKEEERFTNKLALVKEAHEKAMNAKRRVDQATARVAAIDHQVAVVNNRLEAIRERVKAAAEYENVILPYFTTLRSTRIRERVSLLEAVLPPYVSAMAASQYVGARLRIDVSDDLSSMDVMLKPGRNHKWVSALQASGGQRRRFTLAILGALRETSLRGANLMFFDEPFADLESEGKILLLNRLLPLMLERCIGLDTIFVVAHDQEVLGSARTTFNSVWTTSVDDDGGHIAMEFL